MTARSQSRNHMAHTATRWRPPVIRARVTCRLPAPIELLPFRERAVKPKLTPIVAEKLVAMAKTLATRFEIREKQGLRSRSDEALRRLAQQIRKSKETGSARFVGIPASEQGLRLLRHAHEVFDGRELKRLLLRYGPNKVYLLAKLPPKDRERTVEAGRIRVPGSKADGDVDLLTASVRHLERVVSEVRNARGGRSKVPALPAGLFNVPSDLQAVYEFLVRRMKSLKTSAKSIKCQLRLTARDDDTAELLRRLGQVLDFYRALVTAVSKPGVSHIKMIGDADKAGRRRGKVVGGELWSLLKEARAATRRR